MEMEAKVQYLHRLVREEALHQFDLPSYEVEIMDTYLTVDYLLQGLAWCFTSVISLSKQIRAMRCCMKTPFISKMRPYAARLIDLNEYLDSFPGAIMAYKIGINERNGILLNSMPNR